MSNNIPLIGAVILAGGKGSRMDYSNKGLMPFGEQNLTQCMINILLSQVSYLAISANQDVASYQALGYPVFSDEPQWQGIGPLAGIATAFNQLPPEIELIQIVPCDTPFLPDNLVQNLATALIKNPTSAISYACTDQRQHPSVLLAKRAAIASLSSYLKTTKNYSIRAWMSNFSTIAVVFENEDLFININHLITLAQLSPTRK